MYLTTARASYYHSENGSQEISISLKNPRIINVIRKAIVNDTYKEACDGHFDNVVENSEYINCIDQMYANWEEEKSE